MIMDFVYNKFIEKVSNKALTSPIAIANNFNKDQFHVRTRA